MTLSEYLRENLTLILKSSLELQDFKKGLSNEKARIE